MRGILKLLGVFFFFAVAGGAVAAPRHGVYSGTPCPYPATYIADGCSAANQNASFLVTNTTGGTAYGYGKTMSALLNTSTVPWTSTHPQPFNVPGVDYPIGPDKSFVGAYKDPATINGSGESIPACTYSATGNATNFQGTVYNKPKLTCTMSVGTPANNTFTLNGYDFGPTGGHGATSLRINGPTTTIFTGTITLTNNHFSADQYVDNSSVGHMSILTQLKGETYIITDNIFDGGFSFPTNIITTSGITAASATSINIPNTSDGTIAVTVYNATGGQKAFITSNVSGGTNVATINASSPLCNGGQDPSLYTTGQCYVVVNEPIAFQRNPGAVATSLSIILNTGAPSSTAYVGTSPGLSSSYGSIGLSCVDCSALIKRNAFINMPVTLGGFNLADVDSLGTTYLDIENNFGADFNVTGQSHGAWFPLNTSNGTTTNAPNTPSNVTYSWNLCGYQSTVWQGKGSTCYSFLGNPTATTDYTNVHYTNITVTGNTAVINKPSASLPPGGAAAYALMFFNGAAGVTGTMAVNNNYIDPQGAFYCAINLGTASAINGSLSGTTMTVTSLTGAIFTGQPIHSVGGAFTDFVLGTYVSGGTPGGPGVYNTSVNQTVASFTDGKAMSTPINVLDWGGTTANKNLTDGSTVLIGTAVNQWTTGAVCNNHF